MENSTKPSELLDEWFYRARLRERVHFIAAGRFERRRLWIGGLAGGLSAIVGTSVFQSLTTVNQPQPLYITLGTGLVSVLVAVLAAMQTILPYSDLSKRHHEATAGYGKIRRLIEEVRAFFKEGSPLEAEVMTQIRNLLDNAASAAPEPPHRLWKKAEKALEKEDEKLRKQS